MKVTLSIDLLQFTLADMEVFCSPLLYGDAYKMATRLSLCPKIISYNVFFFLRNECTVCPYVCVYRFGCFKGCKDSLSVQIKREIRFSANNNIIEIEFHYNILRNHL